ncbi:hypothetical protein [Sphingobium sp. HDIP04]|uniref:hypothetical protein n=1 Tax=Sphingobium sp. HDIP04 TaxID=428994 RepID=UPI00038785D8|nr:hypothetical protein [Sphingobium sp. HDIP04]EQA97266.1 hypothetical protein L286_23355 [Sphingobium sp. HDIP04]
MPASASRIGFITQAVRNATAGPDGTVIAKYGDQARDTEEPLECFFDNVEDAEAVAAERLALLSPDRRRFVTEISGTGTGESLDFNMTAPTARIIDSEKSADLPAIVVELGIDYETDRSVLTTWG